MAFPALRWMLGVSVAGGLAGAAQLLAACGETASTSDATMPMQEAGPACPNGLVLCSGQCVDLQRDPSNCGMCATACNASNAEVCSMGKCGLTCGGGSTKCGTMCIDIQHDPNNCGMCGMKCDPGFLCTDGGCALSCMQGLTICDGVAGKRCTNLQSDDKNCGMCGKVCDPGFRCDMGNCTISCQMGLGVCPGPDGGDRCVDLRVDPGNCGTCGTTCEAGTFCSGPPPLPDGGDAGAPSCGLGCFGGTTKCGNKCVDTKIDPFNCGGCFQACDGGQSCKNSQCQ